jgi:ribosome-associated heat shock protein Hsp15
MKSQNEPPEEGLRIDKWLWCTRFFKSRSQATAAVTGGLVHINDERVKPSRLVQVNDRIRITRDELRMEIIVQGMPQRRGPAPEARSHYEETPESIAARETRRELARLSGPSTSGRPDKHTRRAIRELKKS